MLPAEYTNTSMPPKSFTVCSTHSCPAAVRLKSASVKIHRRPSDSMSDFTFSTPSSSCRAAMAILAPQRARSWATAAPIPCEPPVISATALLSSVVFFDPLDLKVQVILTTDFNKINGTMVRDRGYRKVHMVLDVKTT